MHLMYVGIHVMCLRSQWIRLGAIGLLLLGVRLSVSPDCNIDALDVALGLAGSAVTFKHQALLLCLVQPWYRLRKGKRGPSIQPFGDGYFRCLLLPVSSLSLWQAVIRIWGPLSHLTSSIHTAEGLPLPVPYSRAFAPLAPGRRGSDWPTNPAEVRRYNGRDAAHSHSYITSTSVLLRCNRRSRCQSSIVAVRHLDTSSFFAGLSRHQHHVSHRSSPQPATHLPTHMLLAHRSQ
ncbi:hypothetical protein HDV62DRAFT_96092 [Trichoderma sp. SZMC 28011]